MRRAILMPDLGYGETPLTFCQWLVEIDEEFAAGDSLFEVTADGVSISISAETDGVLTETLAAEDEPVLPGQILGYLENAPVDL